MKKETLEIKCEGSFMVDWQQLINMQGNLKSLSDENLEKGKRSFIENGFIDSFKVWFKINGKKQPVNTMKILDGHQRAEKIIPALIESGMSIPKMLPADKVFASTKKQAIKCLLTFVSQLGHVEPEGLHEFIIEHDLDFEFIQSMDDYPGINLDVFAEGYINGFQPVGIEEQGRLDEKVKVTCPECGNEF